MKGTRISNRGQSIFFIHFEEIVFDENRLKVVKQFGEV